MPWRDEDSRSLLLELWMQGSAKRRTRQREALEHLERAGWTTATSRASEVALVDRRRFDLAAMLDGCWEEWRSVAQALALESLPPTVSGLRELRRRQRELPQLPDRLSQRTAAALVADHSKASLGVEHLDMLGDTRIMRDGAALIRSNAGLELVRDELRFGAAKLMELQGVLAITQRALQDGTRFEGARPGVVMTVENLGAFADLPKPDWLLLVHVPGWNVPLAVDVIEALGPDRVVHFGDLDPNGIRIFELLSARPNSLDILSHFGPQGGEFLPVLALELNHRGSGLSLLRNGLAHFGVQLWVPELWREVIAAGPVLTCDWPDGLLSERHPALVHELATRGRWAEQERVVVAKGVEEALSALR